MIVFEKLASQVNIEKIKEVTTNRQDAMTLLSVALILLQYALNWA